MTVPYDDRNNDIPSYQKFGKLARFTASRPLDRTAAPTRAEAFACGLIPLAILC